MNVDVLVVGAGPTGLTIASELLRHGLTVRIVDKAKERSPLSRALAVHARTLEIFDDFGIAEKIIARGTLLHGVTLFAAGAEIARVDFDNLDTRHSFALCVPQSDTEAVLTDYLESRGGEVERGVELVTLTAASDGVDALLARDGAEETTRASWVVGCDGSHSVVRKSLGIAFEGHTYEETFLLADVVVGEPMTQDRISTYFAEDGVVAFFPLPKPGIFRVVASVRDGADTSDPATLEALEAIAQRRAARRFDFSNPTWLTWFRIHCRQVDRYRQGRVFLAGDAAHIHSPVGGQGMNTGIQDAHNLAWKLALVHRGRANEILLESYTIERHAVGRALLRATDVATKFGTLKGALASALRNQVARFVTSFEHVRQRIARQIAELDIRYDESPIVGESVRSPLVARFGRPDAGESPTIASRIAFAGGPKPGARAPDVILRRAGEEARSRLAETASGRAFTLLLFDGRAATATGYETLVRIARETSARFGEHVTTYVVTSRDSRPPEIAETIPVLLDVAGELEARYRATTECAYVLRPDLYIGFRSQPADAAAIAAYLEELLVPG